MSAAPLLEDGPGLDDLLAGRLPDERGRFGPFGGRYVPETLVPALDRLEAGVKRYLHDEGFRGCLAAELRDWVGRETPLTPAPGLGRAWGAEVWLKREDLAHTGAHKINNALGQAMLAKALGAKRIVAETGAGQHGVASAAACARVGLPCIVYMGAIDCERQSPNVDRMRRLGAEVVPVTSGDQTLRAAIDEALRDWVSDPEGTYYLLGSAVGPHPYPYLVREFHRVIGDEARKQWIESHGQRTGLSPERMEVLLRRYGTVGAEVAAYITAEEDSVLQNHEGYTRREIEYMVRSERVFHLDDLLLRRTVIALLGELTSALMDELVSIMAPILGWSDQDARDEKTRTLDLLKDKFGISEVK